MSKTIPFYKANSIGNIIGIVKEKDLSCTLTPAYVRSFCNKSWGIDCDQLMVVGPIIAIWNKNGTTAEACGNGTRCVISILKDTKDTHPIVLQGPIGPLEGWYEKNGHVSVVQGPVTVGSIHGIAKPPETIVFADINVEGIPVHVGNPHVVVLNPPPENLDPLWKPVHPLFPQGLNVSFVSSVHEKIFVQTWERGVGRTLSCGSGACAVAATLHTRKSFPHDITLETPGGAIHLKKTSRGWIHTAPAHIVATGHWVIPADHCMDTPSQ